MSVTTAPPPIRRPTAPTGVGTGEPRGRGGWVRALGPLVAVVLALPAIWPLLATPGLPVTDDGLFHLYRLYEFAGAWPEQGSVVRWSDRFMYGAGFPFFSLYAPLVYYLGAALMALGADATLAFKLLFALGCALSAWTMYRFTAERLGSVPAGWLAAAAYVYAPYYLVDIYRRGSVADAFAFALMPACLGAARHLLDRPALGRGLALAALVALLVCAHNAVAFFFLPLLALYAALVAAGRAGLLERRPAPAALGAWLRRLLPPAAALTLALALAAWFWLPALVERDALDLTPHRTGYFDFRNHWDDGWPAVQGSLVFDWSTPFRAGLVQAMLAGAGLVAILALGGRGLRREALFWVAVGLGALALMWPGSAPLWEALPLLAYAEFAWRLLPFVALATAWLTGALAACPPRLRPGLPVRAQGAAGAALALGLGLALAATGLAGLTPAWEAVSDFRPLAISNTTRVAGWNVLPAQLATAPAPVGGPVELLDAAGSFAERRLRLRAGGWTTLTLHAFAFPGWELTVDGRATPYRAVAPDGLVAFDLPPGEHEVRLTLGRSGVQRSAELISAAALAAVALAAAWNAVRRRDPRPRLAGLAAAGLALLGALALLLAGVAFRPGPSDGSFRAVNREVAAGVRLAGYAVEPARLAGGGYVDLTLYWYADRAPGQDLPIGVWLVDEPVDAAGVRNTRAVGDALPTDRWPPGLLVADRRRLDLPPGQTLDRLRLKLLLDRWDSPTGTRTPVGELVLGLADGRPASFAVPAGSGPSLGRLLAPVEAAVAGAGGAGSVVQLAPGSSLDVRVRWQALAAGTRDYVLAAHLVDAHGRTVAVSEREPRDGRYPTAAWSPGEVVELDFPLALPGDLPVGEYRLALSAFALVDRAPLPPVETDGSPLGRPLDTGLRLVRRPEPIAALPPAAHPLNAVLGGEIELLGWQPGDEPGTYRLYWRAVRPPGRDYTLFLHALGPDGALVAQHDGPPLDGAYPTTLWRVGEIVATSHRLPPVAGAASPELHAGLYWLETLERLRLPDGSDSVVLRP